MSRTYSPDEMATPRDPSRELRENEPGLHRDEEGQGQGRSGDTENQSPQARRKRFGNQRLVPLSLGSPTNTVTALTPSEAPKLRL